MQTTTKTLYQWGPIVAMGSWDPLLQCLLSDVIKLSITIVVLSSKGCK
jgi:hypothetical protein